MDAIFYKKTELSSDNSAFLMLLHRESELCSLWQKEEKLPKLNYKKLNSYKKFGVFLFRERNNSLFEEHQLKIVCILQRTVSFILRHARITSEIIRVGCQIVSENVYDVIRRIIRRKKICVGSAFGIIISVLLVDALKKLLFLS